MGRGGIGAVAVAAVLAGCTDPTGPVDVLGTYTLRTIDGQPLPAVVAEDDQWREEVLGGSIRLDPGDGCSVTRSWRVVQRSTGQGVEHEFRVACTYTIEEDALVMTFADRPDEREPASIGDGFITQLVAGAAWVFQK